MRRKAKTGKVCVPELLQCICFGSNCQNTQWGRMLLPTPVKTEWCHQFNSQNKHWLGEGGSSTNQPTKKTSKAVWPSTFLKMLLLGPKHLLSHTNKAFNYIWGYSELTEFTNLVNYFEHRKNVINSAYPLFARPQRASSCLLSSALFMVAASFANATMYVSDQLWNYSSYSTECKKQMPSKYI